MNKNQVIEIVVSKLPLLNLSADQMPTEAEVRLWLGGAMHNKTKGGHASFYSSPPRGASPEVQALARLIKFHGSAGGLWGLMAAKAMVSNETWPRIETVGTLIAVLSGKTPAIDRWAAVLGRAETTTN